MDTFVVHLSLPPKALRANAKAGWKSKHYRKVAYRDACIGRCLAALGGYRHEWPAAVVDIVWRAERSSWLPDPSNVVGSLKFAFDALQAVGVIQNDRTLAIGSVRTEVGESGVTLAVRREDAA